MAKTIVQSASRIDTFLLCSQLYAAKYLWKIPDGGNDGSNRGWVAHKILELLLKPRHRKRYDEIRGFGNCMEVPSIWRLIQRLAEKRGVNTDEHLKLINGYLMTALKNDFFGPKGTKEILAEKDFSINVDERGIKFSVRGLIDKIFVIEKDGQTFIEIVDYKSSKTKHKGDKLDHNYQNNIYQFVAKYLFPKAILRRFHFLFLAFPKVPVQEQSVLTKGQLDGFAMQMTVLQKEMENFTVANSADRLAFFDDEKKRLCGGEGFKKDGAPRWICPAQRPMDYFVLMNANGEFIASAMQREQLVPKQGQAIIPMHYGGCPIFYDLKTGKRKNVD